MQCLETAQNGSLLKQFPRFSDALSLVETLKPDYSIYCLRPQILADTAKRFIELFPGKVMYAVKCNPHPLVLDALCQGGINRFDVASASEVAQIGDTYPNAQIYFMHPVKSRPAIRMAYWEYGVRHFAVDHYNELQKILEETGGKDLTIVVRIKTPPSEGSLYHLAKKFGAETVAAANLMQQAAKVGCKVGITFHVGSQCIEPQAYSKALDMVGEVMEISGIQPVCIDVGGGFPVAYPGIDIPPLEDYMTEIERGLERVNPTPEVEIFAEPGRALVAAGCSLLTHVQLRKQEQLFINDGVYGALSELLDSKNSLLTKVVRLDGSVSKEVKEFSVCGVTCDSTDMLPSPLCLPVDVKEGDWLEIDHVGAYSNALSTKFNGFCSDAFAILDNAPPSLVEQSQQVLVAATN
ncbi:MAG: type III PLP-dependent enzyme [Xenococcaceae cyanobacterium MO_167.B27]|nr:type III PLP-dependent enzyme [Xenococcaceae cyanobacterium MO_167.B27]